MPLNALVAHVEAKRRERGFDDQPAWLPAMLLEELGEVAKEVRRLWAGKSTPARFADELLDCLQYLLRLAFTQGVDLEQAVRAKEAHNATRTWDH